MTKQELAIIIDHEALDDAIRANIRASAAPATIQAYESDWRAFLAFCRAADVCPLPAEPKTIAAYMSWLDLEGRAVSSIERALTTLNQAHSMAGLSGFQAIAEVQRVRKGLRRRRGIARQQARPLRPVELRACLRELGDGLRADRDRCLLTLGFGSGMRASELVALCVSDVSEDEAGLVVLIRRSKTDQEGRGRKVGIVWGQHLESCPVRSFRAWRASAELEGQAQSPLIRSLSPQGKLREASIVRQTVTRVIRRALRLGGLDPQGYSSHSLRAGFVTAAHQAGHSPHAIMAQTGHRSFQTLEGYIRDSDIFKANASENIGL
jgi:integrase